MWKIHGRNVRTTWYAPAKASVGCLRTGEQMVGGYAGNGSVGSGMPAERWMYGDERIQKSR